MPARLQEVHPAVVHFPIALLPTALALGAVGQWTDGGAPMESGKHLMPVAAASALVSGAAGFVAQGAVRAEGKAHDLLVTHRKLNLPLVVLTGVLAATRLKRGRPGWAYWLAGLAGVATMAYTATIGGRMVYEHGLGVGPAGGLREDKAPEIRTDDVGGVARAAVDDASHAVKHLAGGEIAPALRPNSRILRSGLRC